MWWGGRADLPPSSMGARAGSWAPSRSHFEQRLHPSQAAKRLVDQQLRLWLWVYRMRLWRNVSNAQQNTPTINLFINSETTEIRRIGFLDRCDGRRASNPWRKWRRASWTLSREKSTTVTSSSTWSSDQVHYNCSKFNRTYYIYSRVCLAGQRLVGQIGPKSP